MMKSSTRPPTFSTRFRAGLVPWIGFNWRYDSGLTAGSTPCYGVVTDPNSLCAATSTTLNGQPAIDLSAFTADQEFEAGPLLQWD